MLISAIQNISRDTQYKKSISREKHPKLYGHLSYTPKYSLSRTSVLNTPCDSILLIKNNTVNFTGTYDIRTLNPEELAAMKADVKRRMEELNIKLYWRQGDYLFNDRYEIIDTGIQVMNILLNHPIIKCESVKAAFSTIASTLTGGNLQYSRAVSMLDFADFITQDDNKKIYKNETVQTRMGEILFDIMENDTADIKKVFVKFLNKNSESLPEDTNFGQYLAKVNLNNFLNIIREINDLKIIKQSSYDILSPLLPQQKPGIQRGIKCFKNGDSEGFGRIGGQKQAIETIKNMIIFPQKYPQLYKGFNTEKGAILYGPAGTGKSLMAQAIAEELGYYYISISAGDMRNKYVGETEKNWSKLFKELEQNQPALLFVDEFDAMASNRDTSDMYTKQELGHVLKLISDIKAKNLKVFILAATNRLQDIDPAILRSGRISEKIMMLPPQTVEEAGEIFDIHIKGKKIDIEDINENRTALLKAMLNLQYTGADIEKSVLSAHEAALKRTGLHEKMESGETLTEEEVDSYNIKAVDFYTALKMNEPPKTYIPQSIPPIYKTKRSKENTIAILGSSKTADEISAYIDMCRNFVKSSVQDGKNIVTGCGNAGIMGAAYTAAQEFSEKDKQGKPKQNLAILINPLYGDEDLENCIPLTWANSQAERIEYFSEVSDTMVIFPGSTTTLQEAATLISKNYYGNPEDRKKIILVGKSFFKDLVEQYNTLYKQGLMSCQPSELFTIADSEQEIHKIING